MNTVNDLIETPEVESGNVVFRLTKPKKGLLRSLALVPEARKPRPKNHVRIKVDALGLNFRDVLIALNRYPDADMPLGVEFAGRILETEGSFLKAGSPVFGVMLDSFASEVVLPAHAVAPFPRRFSPATAAALPVAYLTAWRGLVEMANLRPSQTVLIHHGSGGVGLAAIHLSQRIGARIIATAGTDEKRDYLRGLGIEHVCGSRDDGFVEHVLRVTEGQGADVVIGALPPLLVQANLACIADCGFFVDMGKNGVPEAKEIARLRPNLRYSCMQLDADAVSNPNWVGRTLGLINGELETGALPTLPITEFSVDDAHKAFRYMARAQHLGKVIMNFP